MKKILWIIGCLVVLVSLSLVAQEKQSTKRTPRVTRRQANQQGRIVEGEKSGQLTPAESQRLERQQAKIEKDKQDAKSDGTVTPQEKAKLTKEQNRASRRIARLKHNGTVEKK